MTGEKKKWKFYFTKVSNENSKNSFNLKLTDSQIGSIGIRKILKNNSKSPLFTLKLGSGEFYSVQLNAMWSRGCLSRYCQVNIIVSQIIIIGSQAAVLSRAGITTHKLTTLKFN